jgi:TPP-dependent pyruvate/acetoin dehydrogenase alpha subunit
MAKQEQRAKSKSSTVPDKVLLEMYRKIYAIRRFELACVDLYRQGFIRGYFHPYLGEEAVAAGACTAVEASDYIISTHRGHGHCISKGGDLKLMMAEIMGKETGFCKGRGGSMHISCKDDNNLGANGIVGGGIPIGTGAGMGIKIKGTKQVVINFFSDGASNNGVFAESINLAAIYKLPVIFMIENNHYAVGTKVEYASGNPHLVERGPAYGIPGVSVDGNDAVAVYIATKEAAERARAGEGATLIEAKTYRHGGHHVNDPGLYMDQELLKQWKEKDPMKLLKEKIEDKISVEEIEKEIDTELAQAIEFAKSSPEPSVDEFLKCVINE